MVVNREVRAEYSPRDQRQKTVAPVQIIIVIAVRIAFIGGPGNFGNGSRLALSIATGAPQLHCSALAGFASNAL